MSEATQNGRARHGGSGGRRARDGTPADRDSGEKRGAVPRDAGATAGNLPDRILHSKVLTAGVYAEALAPRLGGGSCSWGSPDSALRHVEDLFTRMGPRDAAEEMLVAQMLLTHARVLHLTSLANRQTAVETIQGVNECADRASNTYRRQMLTLAEYRRPPRPGDTYTVQQTNIAAQQVVNAPKAEENATNEQGSGGRRALPAPLPADAERDGLAAIFRGPKQAVEPVHRAAYHRGQGPVAPERPAAR